MKVNVWQVGYPSFKDYILKSENVEVREMGYVEIPSIECWEEEVWHLLNWSCWNYDDNGDAFKPNNVHSTLDHCNSDIILHVVGTYGYKTAMPIGWATYSSLDHAINSFKERRHSLWPFSDVKFCGGYTKIENGKAYIKKNNRSSWEEINF